MAENKYYNLEKVIDEYLYAEDFEVKKRLLRNLDDDINHKETLELLSSIMWKIMQNVKFKERVNVNSEKILRDKWIFK